MSSNSKSTRQWHAESLVKRLLEHEDEPVSVIVAAAFDLSCEQELDEALQVVKESKQRALHKTCSEEFANFAVEVDTTLKQRENVESAKKLLASTHSSVQTRIQAVQKAGDSLKEANSKLRQIADQRQQVELALRWMERQQRLDELQEQEDEGEEERKIVEEHRQELMLYQGTSNTARRLLERLHDRQVSREAMKRRALEQWMVYAYEKGKELGRMITSRDVALPKRHKFEFERQSVVQYFASQSTSVEFDLLFDFYSRQRKPAFSQACSGITRATSISALASHAQDLCGFFFMEQVGRVFNECELSEMWWQVEESLMTRLEENEEMPYQVFMIWFRTCLATEMNLSRLYQHVCARGVDFHQMWVDYSTTQLRRIEFDGSFAEEFQLEYQRCLNDFVVLSRFTGLISDEKGGAWSEEEEEKADATSGNRAQDELKAIMSVIFKEKATSGSSSQIDLNKIIDIYISVEDASQKHSFFEEMAELLKQEALSVFLEQNMSVDISSGQVMEGTPNLLDLQNQHGSLKPHAFVTESVARMKASPLSSSSNQAPTQGMKTRAQLGKFIIRQAVTFLSTFLTSQLMDKLQVVNPVCLKQVHLDVLVIQQEFPQHLEILQTLFQTLEFLCVDTSIQLESFKDEERLLVRGILRKFQEMDGNSRLFASNAVKSQIKDLKQHQVNKLLAELHRLGDAQ